MDEFLNILKQLEIQHPLEKLIGDEEFLKDSFLLREGQIARKLYFVESGLLRGFHYKDSKEVINWFSYENLFATAMYSFVSQKPSYENIQALENTKVKTITYQKLQDLYKRHPDFERIGRLLTEQYYIQLEERLISLQFQTAKERYENILQKEPQLIHRISLGHLASYLGMTQENLSRVRSK